MYNRNRIGVIVIVASLLFDLFIIKHQKTGCAASRLIRCYPANGIKGDTVSNIQLVDKRGKFHVLLVR